MRAAPCLLDASCRPRPLVTPPSPPHDQTHSLEDKSQTLSRSLGLVLQDSEAAQAAAVQVGGPSVPVAAE